MSMRRWQVRNNGTGQFETVEPLVRQICEFDSIKKRSERKRQKGRSSGGDGYLEVSGMRNWPGGSLETLCVGLAAAAEHAQ